MFGYSKPHEARPPTHIANLPFYTFAHTESVSQTNKMTLSKDAGIMVKPLGPVPDEEMAIQYVAGRSAMYRSFDWLTTDPEDKILACDYITPQTFFYRQYFNVRRNDDTFHNGTDCIVHTFISYLASMFMYWRGGIKLTFNVAANKYFSGRLRILYQLDAENASPVANPTQEPVKGNYIRYFSKIIDIRDANTFTVEFPYVDVNPWRTTTVVGARGWERAPKFYVIVEKALKSPESNVGNKITTWISVSAADDFVVSGPRITSNEFNVPYAYQFFAAPTSAPSSPTPTPPANPPLSPPTTPAAEMRKFFELNQDLPVVRAQGFTKTANSDATPAEIMMTERPPHEANVAAHTRAVGDPITSLRSLLHRPMMQCQVSMAAGSMGMINPWESKFYDSATDTTNLAINTFLDRVKALYRFQAGGMRIYITGLPYQPVHFKTINTEQIYSNKTQFTIFKKMNGGVYVVNPFGKNSFLQLPRIADSIVREDLSGMASFELPYYTIYERADNMTYMPSTTDAWDIEPSGARTALVWYNDVDVTLNIYVAVADDYSMGYLMGPPITFTSTRLN